MNNTPTGSVTGSPTLWLPEPPRPPVTDDPDPSSPWGWYGYNGGVYRWIVGSDGGVIGVVCQEKV